MKKIIEVGFLGLLIIMSTLPIAISNDVKIINEEEKLENFNFLCYNKNEFNSSKILKIRDQVQDYNINEELDEFNPPTDPLFPSAAGGPINSSWPMYCHDVHHTGSSPYSTANNTGYEKWIYHRRRGWIEGGVVIDGDGNIYFGSKDSGCDELFALYALYPNGTLKWKCGIGGRIIGTPAIAEDGTIYLGTSYGTDALYAISSNGTIKWRYKTGDLIFSSPAIDEDGSIYFGDWKGWINALYPNGTLKWRYKTGNAVLSSPAIGDNGVVYCGSHDSNLYALYTNNGTIKWKYKTGGWVRVSPCIGDDGTIFFVSLDSNLYAVKPNGTLKWKRGVGAGTSPTIGQDGTIYAGYTKLYAINPDNGTEKWKFNPGEYRYICGSTPAHSLDGTIYFGTNIGVSHVGGGELIAVNPNGTQKWRSRRIANEWIDSPCAIGEDGTVYIGTVSQMSIGEIYAFNVMDQNAPQAPTINGPATAVSHIGCTFNFTADGPSGEDVYIIIYWGDSFNQKKIGPIKFGEKVSLTHIWEDNKKFTLRARAINTNNSWGPWSTHEIDISENQMPTTPEKPIGSSIVMAGKEYIYATYSTDPEGQRLKYHFNWGDGKFSSSGWKPSGEYVIMSKVWKEEGTYAVVVRAQDEATGWESYDSWPKMVIVMKSKDRPMFNPFFNWILERHPNAVQLLKYILTRIK